MVLVCPNCGSGEIVYAGTSTSGGGGYEATDQRYHCKKCDYTGPLVIDTDEGSVDDNPREFPYSIVVVIAFISLASFGLGANLISSALFFAIPTALLLGFHYFIKEEDKGGVEKDLENLGEDGRIKGSSARRV
jgi:predicted RNA-binding Zn-ribbon protein involved in translation (DUF1610 family)